MLKKLSNSFLLTLTLFFPLLKGWQLRNKLYNLVSFLTIDRTVLSSSVKFIGSGHCSIGVNSFVGHYTKIMNSDSSVRIGDFVDISSNVLIITGTHELGNPNVRAAGKGYSLDVIIEDHCWLGANVTILGGVTVGNGAIVGAGTLVSKNVPEKSMVAGNPMRIIKTWSVKDNMWVKYEN